MGHNNDELKFTFSDVCKQFGFSAEDGLSILKSEFNRRVDNTYDNYIMTVCIDHAFEDQKRRKVELNKNRALIPILARLCHFSKCYPTNKGKPIPRLNPATKKMSKGYVPVGKIEDRGNAAQEEWNKILKEKFNNNTFRAYDYQPIIKTLLKRYDTVKKKEKIYNFWKNDFLKVVSSFKISLSKTYTFEELENLVKNKRLKAIKIGIK
jgi:hypothetical protein